MKTLTARTIWDLPFEALRKIKALERKHIEYEVQTQRWAYEMQKDGTYKSVCKDTWHTKGYYKSNLSRKMIRVFYDGEISVFLIRSKNSYNGKLPKFSELELARLSNDGTLYYNRQLYRNWYNQWVICDRRADQKEDAKYLDAVNVSEANFYCDDDIVCGADGINEFLRTSGLAPYFYNPTDRHIWNYYEFVKSYKENLPMSELLCKAGYLDLAMDGKVCHCDKAQRSRFVGYLKRYKDELLHRQRPLTYHVLDYLSRHDIPYLKYVEKKQAQTNLARLNKHLSNDTNGSVPDELVEHLRKNCLKEFANYIEKYGFWNWRDYIHAAIEIGWDWKDKGVYMPFHFEEAHDQATSLEKATREEREAKKQKEMDKKILAYAKLIGEATYDGIVFKPMRSTKDFISTGNRLKNCVGRCAYNKKMAEHLSFCVRLYENKKLVYCAEIDGKASKILQLYAKRNTKDERYKEIEKATLKYIRSRKGRLNGTADEESEARA